MKHKVLLLVGFFSICFSYAQNDNENNLYSHYNNGLEVHMFFGNTTLKAKGVFKTNAQIRGGGVTKRFIVKNSFSVGVGIESYFVEANYLDNNLQNLFITNSMLQIPFTLRYDLFTKDNISAFVDAGFYGSYLYQSKIENELAGSQLKEKGEGLNLGLVSNIGLKYKVNKILNINMGLRSQSDLFRLLDKDVNYTINNLYAFQIGASISLK